MDLAGLEWSTGSGSQRCGEEQSCGRHGGEDGAARWGRDVSEEKAGARGERVAHAGPLRAGGPSVCGWKRAQAGLVRPGPADWAGLGRKEVGRGFGFEFWVPFLFHFFFLSKSNSNKV